MTGCWWSVNRSTSILAIQRQNSSYRWDHDEWEKNCIPTEKGTGSAACQPHGYREDETTSTWDHVLDQHKWEHKFSCIKKIWESCLYIQTYNRVWGGVIKGRHPQIGVVCCNTHKTEKQPPTTCNVPKPCRSTEAWGPLGGVYTPGGAYKHMGAYKCTGGCTNIGVCNHPLPKYKHMPTTKK